MADVPHIQVFLDDGSPSGNNYVVRLPDGSTRTCHRRTDAVNEATYYYSIDSADVVVSYVDH